MWPAGYYSHITAGGQRAGNGPHLVLSGNESVFFFFFTGHHRISLYRLRERKLYVDESWNSTAEPELPIEEKPP